MKAYVVATLWSKRLPFLPDRLKRAIPPQKQHARSDYSISNMLGAGSRAERLRSGGVIPVIAIPLAKMHVSSPTPQYHTSYSKSKLNVLHCEGMLGKHWRCPGPDHNDFRARAKGGLDETWGTPLR